MQLSIRCKALVVWLKTLVVAGLEALIALNSLVLLEALVTLGRIALVDGLMGRQVGLLECLVLSGVALGVIGWDVVGMRLVVVGRCVVIVGAGRGRDGLCEEGLIREIRIWIVAVAHYCNYIC